MKNIFNWKYFVIILFMLNISCLDKSENENSEIKISSFSLFKDSSYMVKIFEKDSANIILTFFQKRDNEIKILLQELLKVELNDYRVEDFDKNGTLDILIQKNWAYNNNLYYLYLTDSISKTLNRVIGFEKIYTPTFDSINNIIVGYQNMGNESLYSLYGIQNLNLIDYNIKFKIKDNENFDSIYSAKLKIIN